MIRKTGFWRCSFCLKLESWNTRKCTRCKSDSAALLKVSDWIAPKEEKICKSLFERYLASSDPSNKSSTRTHYEFISHLFTASFDSSLISFFLRHSLDGENAFSTEKLRDDDFYVMLWLLKASVVSLSDIKKTIKIFNEMETLKIGVKNAYFYEKHSAVYLKLAKQTKLRNSFEVKASVILRKGLEKGATPSSVFKKDHIVRLLNRYDKKEIRNRMVEIDTIDFLNESKNDSNSKSNKLSHSKEIGELSKDLITPDPPETLKRSKPTQNLPQNENTPQRLSKSSNSSKKVRFLDQPAARSGRSGFSSRHSGFSSLLGPPLRVGPTQTKISGTKNETSIGLLTTEISLTSSKSESSQERHLERPLSRLTIELAKEPKKDSKNNTTLQKPNKEHQTEYQENNFNPKNAKIIIEKVESKNDHDDGSENDLRTSKNMKQESQKPKPREVRKKEKFKPLALLRAVKSNNVRCRAVEGGKTVYFFVINGSKYVVKKQIGKGGYSNVYEVVSVESHKSFAVKHIQVKDASITSNFDREIALLEKLRGESSIVTLFDHEKDNKNSQIFMLFQLAESDMAEFLRNNSPLTLYSARYFWGQMVDAVRVLHKARIVHKDLKPQNFVLVNASVKLIDFGLANTVSECTTHIYNEKTEGTPSYMAPECFYSSDGMIAVSRGTDIWSLGVILFEMLVGHTPFHSLKGFAKCHAIASGAAAPLHLIGDPLVSDLVRRCLARSPEKRPSAAQILAHPFLAICRSRSCVF